MSETNGDTSVREMGAFMANILSRLEMVRGLHADYRRDPYDASKLPGIGGITADMYWNMYRREAIPRRVVECLPKESWQTQPSVYEKEAPYDPSGFDEDWLDLPRQLRGHSWFADEKGSPLWGALLQVDIESRIQQYGVLLIGLNDGKTLDQPADLESRRKRELTFLRSFPQQYAKIVEWDTEETSARFMQPEYYELQFMDAGDKPSAGLPGSTSRRVHWSRVLHICDGGTVTATEAMEPVFNNLVGLQKLYCSSPEMFWLGAFPGIGFTTHPSLGPNVKIDQKGLQEMMTKYSEEFQRWFAVLGLQPQQFSPNVVDPSAQIAVQIEAICIVLGIPIRVFKGSERGELASSQDDAAWNDRLRLRQNYYITPNIICRFVDRLIMMGVLREPEEYHVYWPDLESQTAADKAGVAKTMVDTLAAYVAGNLTGILTPLDLLTKFLEIDEAEAQAMIENATAEMEKKAAEEAQQAQELADQGMQLGPDGKPQPIPPPPVVPDPNAALPVEPPPVANAEWLYDHLEGNAFCATGPGGGVDPTCGKGDSLGVKPGVKVKLPGHSTDKAELNRVIVNLGLHSAEHIASLVGAPEGAIVSLKALGSTDIQVKIAHTKLGMAAERLVSKQDDELIVENLYVELPSSQQGKGIGSQMFSEQVAACKAAGVKHIECTAFRDEEHNGHYSWPRMGYDAPLFAHMKKGMPVDLAQAGSVLQLMATEKGREWWKENGQTIPKAIFDLTDNSPSMQIHKAYLEERAKRVTGNVRTEDIDFNALEEAALDAAWERVGPMLTANVFCATGPGGGVDPTCGKDDHGKAWASSLSPAQEDAITQWSTFSSGIIRRDVATGNKSAQSVAFMEALEKAPKFVGTTYRGMSTIPTDADEEAGVDAKARMRDTIASIKKAGIGATFSDAAPASMSSDIAVAQDFAGVGRSYAEGQGILFRMVSRTGRSIEAASNLPAQREVISMPNTKYKVTKLIEGDTARKLGVALVVDVEEV